MAGNRREDGRSLYVEDGKVNKSGTGRSNGVLYDAFPVRGVTRPSGAIRRRVRYLRTRSRSTESAPLYGILSEEIAHPCDD